LSLNDVPGQNVMTPFVTDTVTGTVIVSVPSETVMVVAPLLFAPMPIEVATKVAVDAGLEVVTTDAVDGDTVTMVVSLLVTAIVPLKPLSVTVNCWLPFTPPKAIADGLAESGIGVGVGVGVGLGVGVAVALPDGAAVALPDGAGVGDVDGTADLPPPPPPQPTSTATATRANRAAQLRSAADRPRSSGMWVTSPSFGHSRPAI